MAEQQPAVSIKEAHDTGMFSSFGSMRIGKYLIRVEPVRHLIRDGREIFKVQYDELAAHKDIELNVDESRYIAAEELGHAITITVRVEPIWEIAGYAVFMLSEHGHYKGNLYALQDIFYIAPDHRGHQLGKALLDFTERVLRELDVSVVLHGQKIEHEAFGKLLAFCEYKPTETMWHKRLDK